MILSNAGLTNALIKEFDNILAVMMFNEREEDKETGVELAKELYKIVDKKELSKIKWFSNSIKSYYITIGLRN